MGADVKITSEFESGGILGSLNNVAQSVKAKSDEMQSRVKEFGKTGEGVFKKVGEEGASRFAQLKDKAQASFGEIGKVMAGVLGAGALVGLGSGIASAFEGIFEKGKQFVELKENANKAFQAVGMGAQQAAHSTAILVDQSKELANKYAISSASVMNATQAYLQFGGSTDNLAKKQEIIIGLSERLKAKGMDAAAAMQQAAIMVAKSGGEEAIGGMTKLGINMSATATDAERLEIMSKAAAGGLQGLAEASNSPLAKMQKMQEKVDQVEQSVGEGLVNAAGTVIDVVNVVMDKIGGVISFISDNAPEFMILAGAIGAVTLALSASAIAEGIAAAAAWVTNAAYTAKMFLLGGLTEEEAINAIATGAMTAEEVSAATATGVLEIAMGALNAVMEMNPIALVIGALVILGATFYELYQHVVPFRAVVNATWAALKEGFTLITTVGGDVAAILKDIFTLNFTAVAGDVEKAVADVTAGAAAVGHAAGTAYQQTFTDAAQSEKEKAAKDEEKRLGDQYNKGLIDYDKYKAGMFEVAKKYGVQIELENKKAEIPGGFSGDQGHKTPKATKAAKSGAQDHTLDDINKFIRDKAAVEKTGRAKDLEQAQNAYADEQKKLDDALKAKKITRAQYDAERPLLTASLNTTLDTINKKHDADELKALQEAQTKQRDARAKFEDETEKLRAEALKKHNAAQIALIEDATEKSVAQENAGYEEEQVTQRDALAKRMEELQKLLGDGTLTWQDYHNDVLAAQRMANVAAEDAANAHAKKLADIENNAATLRNATYKAGADSLKGIQDAGFKWLDDRMAVSSQNQKTVFFGVQQSLLGSLKDSVAQQLSIYGKKVAVMLGLQVQEAAGTKAAEGVKQSSFIETAAVAVWSGVKQVGAWIAAAAGSVASGAVIIAKNLAVAASAIASAAAAAVTWLVSTLGPFGLLAAGGVIAAIIAEFGTITKSLGLAKGGMFGLVGEKGGMDNAEVVAPVADFSKLMTMVARETAVSIATAMREPKVRDSGNAGTATAIKELGDKMMRRIDVHIDGKEKSTSTVKGNDIVIASQRIFTHQAASLA